MHQEVATVRDRPGKKERDPESFNRSKRRRSERFAPRNERDVEEDSSDESQGDDDYHQRKSFSSGRIPRHAASLMVADEMIGVPVPRKARSGLSSVDSFCFITRIFEISLSPDYSVSGGCSMFKEVA
jgi:hypothetical protein